MLNEGARSPGQGYVRPLGDETTLSQYALPQLDAHDAEDEEHEEAEQQHVTQHREGVQQQHHQDPHA